MVNTTNEICKAIELYCQDLEDHIDFNKTIQAIIIECSDETIGEYKCKYQDATLIAYVSNPESIKYSKGTNVYVNIPNNDLNGYKIILGSVKKLGVDYIRTEEDKTLYDIDTKDIVLDDGKVFSLTSKYNETLVLYDKESNDNLLQIDEEYAKEIFENSNSLSIETKVKTSLDKKQRFNGTYGIRFDLLIQNNSDKEIVHKNYQLDIDNMTGNPYNFVNFEKQYHIYDVDPGTFVAINKIEIYCENFPNRTENDKKDIFFKDVNLYAATKLSDASQNGSHVQFTCDQGWHFRQDGNKKKEVKATIKLKGLAVTSAAQDIDYYWFREDARITKSSKEYFRLGGNGWRCLNSYFTIDNSDADSQEIVAYNPNKDNTFTIEKEQILAEKANYKCVAEFKTADSNITNSVSGEFTIYNDDVSWDIQIETGENQPTSFKHDIGQLDLTCKITGEDLPSELDYVWTRTGTDKIVYTLEETTEENKQLSEAYEKLQQIKEDLRTNKILPSDYASGDLFIYQEILEALEEEIAKLENQQRVTKEKINSVDLSKVVGQAEFKCSVYGLINEVKEYIGTGSIKIFNDNGLTEGYNLKIHNGDRVFKYSEKGLSPSSGIEKDPIVIEPLSFSLFSPSGEEIDLNLLGDKMGRPYRWEIPNSNTLIISNQTPNGLDPIKGLNFYNTINLSYTIQDKFDYNKSNNQIGLTLDYDGEIIKASTNFVFTKEGDPGTNGTDYICKIFPIKNGIEQGDCAAPIVKLGKTSNQIFFSFDDLINGNGQALSENSLTQFRVKLFNNGEQVEIENPVATVNWKMLGNSYGKSKKDFSLYTVKKSSESGNEARIILNDKASWKPFTWDSKNGYPVNLLQCSVKKDGKTYYSVIPIVTYTENKTDYSCWIDNYSGVKNILYSMNGQLPKFDEDTPLKITVLNNQRDDISNGCEKVRNVVTYNWKGIGSVLDITTLNSSNIIFKEVEELSTKEKEKYYNERFIIPPKEYNGECVSNAIEIEISFDEEGDGNKVVIGYFHIPIYLYLNRYGLSQLNDWDGNSIQLNDEGGYILTPQIGAGSKDDNNTFTGILAGEVLEDGRTTKDIGIVGYDKGRRSIFLDSETGGAVFGKKENGQIIIDPEAGAYLYSNNFFKEYQENGFPSSYEEKNYNSEGMIIDLQTPSIKYGNGNFSVNKDGYITAKGGGSIAGWNIDDNKIYKNGVGMSSNSTNSEDTGAVMKSIDIAGSSEADGVESQKKPVAFYAKDKFFVTHDGDLKVQYAQIGKDKNKSVFIVGNNESTGNSSIFSKGKSKLNSKIDGFYLGNDGISFGRSNYFQATNKGVLKAERGTIGGFTFTGNYLSTYSSLGINDEGEVKVVNEDGINFESSKNGTLYLGKAGIRLGNRFSVNNAGSMIASSGTIGGWTIDTNSISKKFDGINDTLSLNQNGITFGKYFSIGKTNSIAGWKITNTTLESNNISINSNGSISCGDNWKITSGGDAYFKNLYGTIANGKTLSTGDNGTISAGGSSFSGTSGAGTTLGSGFYVNTDKGKKTGVEWIQELVVDKLQFGIIGNKPGTAYKFQVTEYGEMISNVATINQLRIQGGTKIQEFGSLKIGSNVSIVVEDSAGKTYTADKSRKEYNFSDVTGLIVVNGLIVGTKREGGK